MIFNILPPKDNKQEKEEIVDIYLEYRNNNEIAVVIEINKTPYRIVSISENGIAKYRGCPTAYKGCPTAYKMFDQDGTIRILPSKSY